MAQRNSKNNSEKGTYRCLWCGEGEDTFRERLKEIFRSLADDKLAELKYNNKKRKSKKARKYDESYSDEEENLCCWWCSKSKPAWFDQLSVSVLNAFGSLVTGMITKIENGNKEHSEKKGKYPCWWCGEGDDTFKKRLDDHQERIKELFNSLAVDLKNETEYIKKKRRSNSWEKVEYHCWWCRGSESSWFDQLDPEILKSFGSLVAGMIALRNERKKGPSENSQQIPVEDKRNTASTLIAVGNISNWNALLLEIQGSTKNITTKLLSSKLKEAKKLERIQAIGINQLTDEMKEDIVDAFNAIKDNLTFYKDIVAGKDIILSPEEQNRLNNLNEIIQNKLYNLNEIIDELGEIKKEESDLSDSEKEDIKWFNISILKILFPQILSKSRSNL